MTFNEFATDWLEQWPVKQSTRRSYARGIYDAMPVIGHKKMGSITRQDAERVVAKLKRGRSRATVVRLVAGLSACFTAAVDAGIVAGNPFTQKGMLLKRAGLRDSIPAEQKFYTHEDVERMLAAMPEWPLHDQVAVLLMLRLGLTRSEVLGLRVEDLEAGELMVRRGVTAQDGVSETKTAARVRRLPLLPGLEIKLKALIASNALTSMGAEWVFPRLSGRPDHPMSGARFEQRIRARLLEAGIFPPRKHLHAFRHTCARAYLCRGGSVEKLSRFLGHSNITTTFGVYGNLLATDIDRELLEDVA